ncbi:hypothetical protein K469DRAFT_254362 [Zopfia rhizophila CBS 207.26]|uniref:Uncharacterized protein n=1 Tax=Zopfia rhizophila CBS 207.26 TaxID=1314779 RepID=A0A6A6DVD2_9PEZI|nr:hypothetical protein K469DRAFT_254362 [Zopfia rhizophila CBS 207.26]
MTNSLLPNMILIISLVLHHLATDPSFLNVLRFFSLVLHLINRQHTAYLRHLQPSYRILFLHILRIALYTLCPIICPDFILPFYFLQFLFLSILHSLFLSNLPSAISVLSLIFPVAESPLTEPDQV